MIDHITFASRIAPDLSTDKLKAYLYCKLNINVNIAELDSKKPDCYKSFYNIDGQKEYTFGGAGLQRSCRTKLREMLNPETKVRGLGMFSEQIKLVSYNCRDLKLGSNCF